MSQTVKAESSGFLIEAHVLREVGMDSQGELEMRVESQRLVIEAPRGARLQRLAEDLGRLLATHAETLPRLIG